VKAAANWGCSSWGRVWWPHLRCVCRGCGGTDWQQLQQTGSCLLWWEILQLMEAGADFFVLQFSGSLLNISCIFLTCAFLLFLTAWIIFTIITLNSFSHRVPFSSSFIWSYGSLPYSFTGNIFHCCFILSNLLCLWSPFFRFQS